MLFCLIKYSRLDISNSVREIANWFWMDLQAFQKALNNLNFIQALNFRPKRSQTSELSKQVLTARNNRKQKQSVNSTY
jgi:hypothetical protein